MDDGYGKFLYPRRFFKDGKKWEKMWTNTFNAKGLMIKQVSTDYMGGGTVTVEYTMKNGRPSVATMTSEDVEGNKYISRVKFTYTTKKTDKKRFAKMINDLTGTGSNFFTWF